MRKIRSRAEEQQLRTFAIEAARLCADRHCQDVHLIDVRGVSQVCDYILIASGTSDRQMRSLAGEIEDLGKDMRHQPFRSSRDGGVTWVVIDFVDLVVHLFEPAQREYYALEELWSDGRSVPWSRPAGGRRKTRGT